MAKEPVMGRVKTRLARQAGAVAATSFYRHAISTVIGRLCRFPRWRTILAVDPDTAVPSNHWPAHVQRIGQGRGELGERMQRLLDELPPGPLIIVGTDIPAITASHIARAFRLLATHDVVLGPAEDGGYWLVGLRRSPRILRPFLGVRWSGPHALADTEANLARCRIAHADRLADVDDLADLRRQAPLIGRRVLPLT
ncbi:MAG: glycosyltransferase [Hyphomicrobiaceae bacterium]|nr:MAG: glycosyltransferase [Hyphomicrobiaceae bacterium]